MTELIVLLGALIVLAGLMLVADPEIILGYLRRNMDQPAIHILAVAVRLVLGTLLILQSDLSKYPLVIELLGWLSIVAGLSLALMGRQRFLRFMSWALRRSRPLGQVGGVLAAAFGGFLVHAFV